MSRRRRSFAGKCMRQPLDRAAALAIKHVPRKPVCAFEFFPSSFLKYLTHSHFFFFFYPNPILWFIRKLAFILFTSVRWPSFISGAQCQTAFGHFAFVLTKRFTKGLSFIHSHTNGSHWEQYRVKVSCPRTRRQTRMERVSSVDAALLNH